MCPIYCNACSSFSNYALQTLPRISVLVHTPPCLHIVIMCACALRILLYVISRCDVMTHGRPPVSGTGIRRAVGTVQTPLLSQSIPGSKVSHYEKGHCRNAGWNLVLTSTSLHCIKPCLAKQIPVNCCSRQAPLWTPRRTGITRRGT